MDRALFAGICLAALGSAIVGGMFYAFSSFVMKALARIRPEQGVAAMAEINVVVINPSFMLAFMGTAVLCLLLALAAAAGWTPGGPLVAAGALLYLLGCFAVTMLRNQPMNLRLARLDEAQRAAYWPEYVGAWTAWNHLRTAAALLAACAFVAALLTAGPAPAR